MQQPYFCAERIGKFIINLDNINRLKCFFFKRFQNESEMIFSFCTFAHLPFWTIPNFPSGSTSTSFTIHKFVNIWETKGIRNPKEKFLYGKFTSNWIFCKIKKISKFADLIKIINSNYNSINSKSEV